MDSRPEERELAEAVEAVSQNRFFVDVVRAMAQFDPLAPQVRDQKDEKQVAAMFFAEKYLDQLQEKKANLFFDFGQDRLPSEARALPFHPRTGTKRIILRPSRGIKGSSTSSNRAWTFGSNSRATEAAPTPEGRTNEAGLSIGAFYQPLGVLERFRRELLPR